MFISSWRVFRQAIKSNASICHFHDPELIPVAVCLALAGRKVIYDVHEDLPRQIMSKHWISPWLRRGVSVGAALIEWISSRVFFSGIVAATPVISERFPRNKTVTVQNFPEFAMSDANGSDSYRTRIRSVAYIGGLEEIRGIREMVQAIAICNRTSPIKFFLAGRFSNSETKKRIESMEGWNEVDFLGWKSRQEVKEILAKSRVGLVVLHPISNYLVSYPVKLFEYMAAGIPVVASDFPLWREIVEDADCGILVDPMNPEAIATAISWLLDNPERAEEMGKNGRRAVEKKYNWAAEFTKLETLYKALSQ